MKKPQTNLTAPCGDCPFRKDSLAGWLGPWGALDLHRFVMAEQPFSCHQTVARDGQPAQETELCAGSILYLNKNSKRCRGDWMRGQQERFRKVDTSSVFNGAEFIERHQGGLQAALNRHLDRG